MVDQMKEGTLSEFYFTNYRIDELIVMHTSDLVDQAVLIKWNLSVQEWREQLPIEIRAVKKE